MSIPYELALGWRYTRAGRASRRNGFISFISGVSMLGIALGVAALIIVLSVMNGFQKEVRDRMLSVISHVEVQASDGGAIPALDEVLLKLRTHPQVVGAASFVSAQALLARGEDMKGVLVRGIDPTLEGQVTDLAGDQQKVFARLLPGQFGVVLGSELARMLGVRVGEAVTLIAPSGQVTPAGVVPRLKQMSGVGLFDSGHFEYDSALVLMHQDDAARNFRQYALEGMTVNRATLHKYVHGSLMTVTALNPHIGYVNATTIAKEALETGASVYDLVIQRGLLDKARLDEILAPAALTGGS